MLGRSCVRCALGVLLTIGCGSGDPTTPESNPRTEGWRSDIDFLGAEVGRRHPPTAGDPGFARFQAALASLRARVGDMSDEAIAVDIQKALAGIGDGHTSIIPIPTATLNFATLPVDFYWFDDGVFIVGASSEQRSLIGARVSEIGGVAIETLVSRVTAMTSSDNASSAKWLGAQVMSYTGILRAAGAASTDQSTSLRVTDAAGMTRSVSIAASSRQPIPRLFAFNGVSSATPRYLQRPDRAYWLDTLPEQRTVYVAFNVVQNDPPPQEGLAAFTARLGSLLQTGRFTRLIIDVRLNNGGDNRLLSPIVEGLKSFEAASSDNRLFVIIGRSTFSAAQNFVNQVERSTHAVFVGEPSGSRPNFPGDDSDIPLPYSKLHVQIASHFYQDSSPTDTRTAIVPQIAVPVRSQDYFGNRDPAFDAALQAGSSSVSGR